MTTADSGKGRGREAAGEFMTRRAGCLNWARPAPWGPEAGNRPGLPDQDGACPSSNHSSGRWMWYLRTDNPGASRTHHVSEGPRCLLKQDLAKVNMLRLHRMAVLVNLLQISKFIAICPFKKHKDQIYMVEYVILLILILICIFSQNFIGLNAIRPSKGNIILPGTEGGRSLTMRGR